MLAVRRPDNLVINVATNVVSLCETNNDINVIVLKQYLYDQFFKTIVQPRNAESAVNSNKQEKPIITPVVVAPVKDAPVKETPVKETPVKQTPVKQTPETVIVKPIPEAVIAKQIPEAVIVKQTEPAPAAAASTKKEKEHVREERAIKVQEAGDMSSSSIPYFYEKTFLVKNEFGNYEHALSHIVFEIDSEKLNYYAWGVQIGNVVCPLSDIEKQICSKNGWIFRSK